MSFEYHSELSKDYLSVFESGKYSDVIIKVGESNNYKEYKAHSFVLKIRSEFFEKEIKNQSGNKITLQYKNFDSQAFEYILLYLYGGSFNLESKDINFILNMLIIVDFIKLTKLNDVLQKYLVDKRKKELNKQFSLIHKTYSKHQTFNELKAYCDMTSQSYPGIIFKADDFVDLDKDVLISTLGNKRLKLYEIEKWDYIIKWGIAQTSLPSNITSNSSSPSSNTTASSSNTTTSSSNPTSSSIYDTSLWTRANFRDLSVTLKPIVSYIDLKNVYEKEFYEKVKPFKKILENNHYDELLKHHLKADENDKFNFFGIFGSK